MTCREVEKQIVLFSELTDDEKALVETHVKECSSCKEMLTVAELMNQRVARAAAVLLQVQHPIALTNTIMDGVRQRRHFTWNLTGLFLSSREPYLKYALAIASLVCIGFFGMEQLDNAAITNSGVIATHADTRTVVLNKGAFQAALQKHRAVMGPLEIIGCANPFRTNQLDEACLRQRLGMVKTITM
jgi:hypothetical protein